MTRITTGRLLLRPLAAGDAAALVRELNNIEISRWTARIPHPYGQADAADFIRQSATAGPGALRLAIIRDGELIGVIGLEGDEIGYWIAQSQWGKGFATEAARAVADHAFLARGAERLVASYQTGNTASRCILTGLGFREAGPGLGFCRATGMETHIMALSLTREDWQAAREQRI